ncbi:hypothetical protein [Streptomyces sp. SYP-A7185]|uniref:hypothetical protein n=1 Tax=Streptomyces sp. SYP-A7185 TaxID=3040076 RepID=UPI0038F7748F
MGALRELRDQCDLRDLCVMGDVRDRSEGSDPYGDGAGVRRRAWAAVALGSVAILVPVTLILWACAVP